MIYFWVFVGGGLGSVTRFGISRLLATYSATFPFGTLLSNVIASLLLAFFLYQLPNKSSADWLPYFLVMGFCGGFSTFSTFSNELVLLFQNGNWLQALLYLIVSVGTAVGSIWWISAK
jgi:fluoride exporter